MFQILFGFESCGLVAKFILVYVLSNPVSISQNDAILDSSK